MPLFDGVLSNGKVNVDRLCERVALH
jgi:hypothetical protein